MSNPPSVTQKLTNALRIDRAVRFVWKASPGWTVVNALLVLVQGVLPLFTLYLVKLIVDTITEAVRSGQSEGAWSSLVLLIGAAAGVALIQAAIGQLAAYAAEAQSTIVTDYIYDLTHKKSIELDLAYYENAQYYDTLHRAQLEGPYRPTKIVNGLNQLSRSGVTCVAMIGLLFTFHWSVGLLLFLSTLPGVVVQIVFARKNYRWQKEITPSERRASYFNWILTGDMFAKELRLFDLGDFFSARFNELRFVIRGEKLELSKKRAIAEFFSQTFGVMVLMACFLLIGIRTIKGMITIGDMVMYFQAFQRGLSSLKEFLQSLTALYEDNLFVSHFFSFLDARPQVREVDQPVTLPDDSNLSIAFKEVEFSYPGVRDQVLKRLSFNIAPGEVVALVGPNGAGKSTIVKLICRLYDPSNGSITYGKIDYRELPLADLRRRISAVFQDFVKYQLSAADNIHLGDIQKKAEPEILEAAAAKAGVNELLATLPEGYDTMLGKWFEKGEELSIGEWQMLVIARAFYRDASFIILDEPSSSLDADSEYQLFLNFKKLISGKSALIISHRFSTVKMADRILVLEDGRILENGSHEELIALDGRYAEMYRKQMQMRGHQE